MNLGRYLLIILIFFFFSCAKTKYIELEMSHSDARIILIENGYTDISNKYDLGFPSGYSLWLDPEKTALLIILYDPVPDARIYQMTLGEKGKGFENWKSMSLT